MTGYNLPESTGVNDPEAPWNKDYEEDVCDFCGCDEENCECVYKNHPEDDWREDR